MVLFLRAEFGVWSTDTDQIHCQMWGNE